MQEPSEGGGIHLRRSCDEQVAVAVRWPESADLEAGAMSDPLKDVGAAARLLSERLGPAPELAIVAGSGLGGFVAGLEVEARVSFAEIAAFPQPTVAGHAGEAFVARAGGRRILVYSGRGHLYEGLAPWRATAPVRAAALWGCRALLLTNAAGGLNPQYSPGDLMLIADQINCQMRSALRGAAPVDWGPRFADLCGLYDAGLRGQMREAGRGEGIALREGTYASMLGPSFETPAEARMLRELGADAVGMSTAPEAIAARQMGLGVLGLSYISNSLVHKADGKTTHEEVLANSRLVLDKLRRLLTRFVEGLAL